MYSRFNSNHFLKVKNSSFKNHSAGDSPTSVMPKMASKLRRGAMGKRVISVPVKGVERLRLKGDHVSSPPSDSWSWRKYGQKPIKGSPYPRGYYRCSSSKACPARKHVERSRADPNMLIITYSSDHNHPQPSSRNIHHRPPPTTTSLSEEDDDDDDQEEEKPRDLVHQHSQEIIENKISNIGEGSLVTGAEFGWLTDFESTSSIILESPILMEERSSTDPEMAMVLSMREEEEEESDLFADLGELPECSTVFRRERAAA